VSSTTSDLRPPDRRPPGRDLLAAFAITVAALVLRCAFLERQALWNDEMFSFDVANLPLADIQSRLLASYHHPPLFFYLLHASLALLGQSAWALRVVPALAGSLTVGLLYLAGKRLFGVCAGLAGAALCLAAPFHLAYSQEGRPYALAGLLCLASTAAMLMALRERKMLWKGLYAASTLALLYTHHWGVFVVLSQAAFMLSDRGVAIPDKKSFQLVLGAVGLCYLPEAAAILGQTAPEGSAAAEWVVAPGPMGIMNLGRAFSGVYFHMASSVFAMPWPLQAAAGAALALLAGALVRQALTAPAQRDLRALLLCAGVTVLVPFAISFWIPKIFLWYRYPVIVFPVFCLAAGSALAPAGRRRLGAAAAFVILLAAGIAGTAHYFTWSKSNVREVAAFVQESTEDSVRMVIRPRSFAFLLNYYYRGSAAQLDESYLDQPLGEIVDTAASFVYVSLDVPNIIRDYMDGHFEKVNERRFPGEAHLGMVVGVYRQKPEPPEEDEEENGE
jgi:4-amino-4-deoxy-L-arabinose transferase-like glycosyltransferase